MSCGFIAYGVGIVFAEGLGVWLVVLGVVITIYGFVSLVGLYVAWRSNQKNMSRVFHYFAAGILLLFVLASFDSGMISGLEYGFLLGVAVLLAINWAAVRVVEGYRGVT